MFVKSLTQLDDSKANTALFDGNGLIMQDGKSAGRANNPASLALQASSQRWRCGQSGGNAIPQEASAPSKRLPTQHNCSKAWQGLGKSCAAATDFKSPKDDSERPKWKDASTAAHAKDTLVTIASSQR